MTRTWHHNDIQVSVSNMITVSPNIIVYMSPHSQPRFDTSCCVLLYTTPSLFISFINIWCLVNGRSWLKPLHHTQADFLRGTNKMSSLWLHVLLLDLFLMMVFCYKLHVISSIKLLCYFGEIKALSKTTEVLLIWKEIKNSIMKWSQQYVRGGYERWKTNIYC